MEKRWTVERLLFVQELTDNGLSSRQIAAMVARYYDCTCTSKSVSSLWVRKKVRRPRPVTPPRRQSFAEMHPIAIPPRRRSKDPRLAFWAGGD